MQVSILLILKCHEREQADQANPNYHGRQLNRTEQSAIRPGTILCLFAVNYFRNTQDMSASTSISYSELRLPRYR